MIPINLWRLHNNITEHCANTFYLDYWMFELHSTQNNAKTHTECTEDECTKKIGKFYHFLGLYFLAVWIACSDSWLCHCWSDHFLSTCPPGSGVCHIVAVTLPWTRLVCCVASRLLGKFLPNSTSNSNWICSSSSDSQTEVTLLGLRQRNQEIQFVISRISMRTGS